MKKSIITGAAIGGGLIGILLGTPNTRDKFVEIGRNAVSHTRQFLSDELIQMQYGTTEAGVKYRPAQKNIVVSTTPIELAKGNHLLARYMTLKNGYSNDHQIINPGTTVETLTHDENGRRLGDLIHDIYRQASR